MWDSMYVLFDDAFHNLTIQCVSTILSVPSLIVHLVFLVGGVKRNLQRKEQA